MDARFFVCPRCGSLDIVTDRITHMGQLFDCPDCGYHGSFVVEADSPGDANRISRELAEDHAEGAGHDEADADVGSGGDNRAPDGEPGAAGDEDE